MDGVDSAAEHSVNGMTELFNAVSNDMYQDANAGNSIMAAGDTAVTAV